MFGGPSRWEREGQAKVGHPKSEHKQDKREAVLADHCTAKAQSLELQLF